MDYAEGGFIGGRVILRPPSFFLPGFKDRVGFPFFAPIPNFVPFALRDNEGFCGAGVFI